TTRAVRRVRVARRAVAGGGGEIVGLRAAAAVKSQLGRKLPAHALRLGPAWLGGQQTGGIATLATKGLDALDPYFARYLPQLVLAVVVPVAVGARVAAPAWGSGLGVLGTAPPDPGFPGPVAAAHQGPHAARVAAAGDARRALPRRGRGAAHAQTVRPGEGAGPGDRSGLGGAPEGDDGHAAGGVLVGAGAGTGGGAGHGAGGGG